MSKSNYSAQLKTYQLAVKTAKRTAFLGEAKKLAQTAPFASLKKLKSHGKPIRNMVNNILHGGVWHVTDSEKVEVLAGTFFNGGVVGQPRTLHHAPNFVPDADFPLVTRNEVSHAIKNQPAFKAPGPNGIHAILLHWAEDVLLSPLTHLFNACLRLSHFPAELKRAKVIVLPKPGKDNYNEVRSYRPIPLLSVFGRVFERIIYQRFQHLSSVARNSWVSVRQFGFHSQRSTVDALDYKTSQCYLSRENKQEILSIKLDMAGVFGTARHKGIIGALSIVNAAIYLVQLTRSYLSDRVSDVTLGNSSARRIARIGTTTRLVAA